LRGVKNLTKGLVPRLKKSALDVGLFILAGICSLQLAVSVGLVDSPYIASDRLKAELLYDLAMGFVVSYGFYLLVVVLPEVRLRKDLRGWLMDDYRRFKVGLIEIYLSAIGDSWESDLSAELLDPQKFSEYFGARYNESQTRWHAVHNGLYEYGIPQLIIECELFVRELQFSRLRSKNISSLSLERLNAISRMLTRVRMTTADYDDIKRLLMVLYPIHCPWNVLDGKLVRDPIEEYISAM
jgi:hypothetical protein